MRNSLALSCALAAWLLCSAAVPATRAQAPPPEGQKAAANPAAKHCAVRDGGFGYRTGQGPNSPRTGVGIFALEICGTPLTPEAVAGSRERENRVGITKFQKADSRARTSHATRASVLV